MKASDPEVLINELMHNAQISGQKPLEQQLANLTIWFYKNKHRIPTDNLAARQAFLEKAFWIMLEVMALSVDRHHSMQPNRRLWVPSGIKVNGEGMFA